MASHEHRYRTVENDVGFQPAILTLSNILFQEPPLWGDTNTLLDTEGDEMGSLTCILALL